MLLRYILKQGLCLVAGILLIASCGNKKKEEKKTTVHPTATIPIDQNLRYMVSTRMFQSHLLLASNCSQEFLACTFLGHIINTPLPSIPADQ